MQSSINLEDGELLRPEPATCENNSGGGALLIGLLFAGLTVFVLSTNNIHDGVRVDSSCPVAAITYCDRQ